MVYVALEILYGLCSLCLDLLLVLLNNNRHLKDIKVKKKRNLVEKQTFTKWIKIYPNRECIKLLQKIHENL